MKVFRNKNAKATIKNSPEINTNTHFHSENKANCNELCMKNKAKQLAQQQQNRVLNYKKRVIEKKTNINRTHSKTETYNQTGNEKVNVEN